MPFYEKDDTSSSTKSTNTRQGNRLISAYFREVAKLPIPTPEQEREMFLAYRNAPDRGATETSPDGPIATKIKKRIAEGYLRFVIKQALGRTKDENLLPDLIAAGNEGLIKAIRKFDTDKGTRFLTYGAWWIRVTMQDALKDAGLGHPPGVRMTHIPGESEDDSPSSAPGHFHYMADPARLPSHDPSTEAVLSAAEFNMLREMNEAALSRRERLILIYYFGLRGGNRRTFGQLSQLLLDLEGTFISSERVRQIKENALRTLRKALKKKRLYSATDVY